MKIKFYNILLAAGLFLLASCDSDNDNAGANSGPVIFKVETSQLNARSTTDAAFKSTFEAGDQIGIYAVKRAQSGTGNLLASGNYADNMKYTKLSDGKWTSETPIVFPSGGEVLDFYAYYPYDANMTDATAMAFSVLTNQSGDTSERSDLMACKNVAPVVTSNEVALTFVHQLTLVQLEVVAATSDIDLKKNLTSVIFKNAIPTVTLNLNSNVSTNGSTPASITMRKVDDGSNTASALYRVLVPAQLLSSGTNLFSLTYTGKGSYGYSLNQDVTLTKGSVKKFKLTISGGGTVLTVLTAGTNVDNWGKGNTDSGEDVSANS